MNVNLTRCRCLGPLHALYRCLAWKAWVCLHSQFMFKHCHLRDFCRVTQESSAPQKLLFYASDKSNDGQGDALPRHLLCADALWEIFESLIPPLPAKPICVHMRTHKHVSSCARSKLALAADNLLRVLVTMEHTEERKKGILGPEPAGPAEVLKEDPERKKRWVGIHVRKLAYLLRAQAGRWHRLFPLMLSNCSLAAQGGIGFHHMLSYCSLAARGGIGFFTTCSLIARWPLEVAEACTTCSFIPRWLPEVAQAFQAHALLFLAGCLAWQCSAQQALHGVPDFAASFVCSCSVYVCLINMSWYRHQIAVLYPFPCLCLSLSLSHTHTLPQNVKLCSLRCVFIKIPCKKTHYLYRCVNMCMHAYAQMCAYTCVFP